MLKGKLNSIQYLRALAALVVVVAHSWDHPMAVHALIPQRLGELGVVLFFVISGYIMVAIAGEGRFSAGDFLKRRAIRIVPLYWIATSAAALLALALPGLFKSTIFSWPHYLLSLLFVPHVAPGTGSLSPIISLGWTLNYEVWFYLCFALLAVLSSKARVTILSVTFAALAAIGAIWHPSSPVAAFYTDYEPMAFCVGCWVGQMSLSGTLQRLPTKLDPLVGVASLAALAFAFAVPAEPASQWPAIAGLALFAGGWVYLGRRFESRLPNIATAVAIGDASYALYLMHMFVVGAVVGVAMRLLPAITWLDIVGIVALSSTLAVAVSLFVHRRVEMPLLDRLHAALVPRRAAQPAAG